MDIRMCSLELFEQVHMHGIQSKRFAHQLHLRWCIPKSFFHNFVVCFDRFAARFRFLEEPKMFQSICIICVISGVVL